jgi:hypothetical protein
MTGPTFRKEAIAMSTITPYYRTIQKRNNLPFNPFATFGKQEQQEHRALVEALVKPVWSPKRLKEAAA